MRSAACTVFLSCAVVVSLTASSSLPLIDAVKAGDRARVRVLAKQPTELKRTEGDGTTALHWAVRADDL